MVTDDASAGRAQGARGTITATELAAPPLHPTAHGGLPPERYPGHRPSPADRRYARRAHPRGKRPSSRRSSLEPIKITVKSAPACGLRVLRMVLRATLDCDLDRHTNRAYRVDGQERSWNG